MTAKSTSAARIHRQSIGEAAIELLGRLGVPVEWIEYIDDMEDPIAGLQKLQAEGLPAGFEADCDCLRGQA